jgi:hypothetical protein
VILVKVGSVTVSVTLGHAVVEAGNVVFSSGSSFKWDITE